MTPIQKTIQSIKRNAEKINEHTWKVYKEQILAHVEDAEYELTPASPVDEKKEGEWIDVNDWFPEICTSVLVCKHNRRVTSMYYNSDKEFVWMGQNQTSQITHWQPLPAPPVEQTKEK